MASEDGETVESPHSVVTQSDLVRTTSRVLETELLRGVALHRVLSHWGWHFSPPDSGMFRVDPGLYQLSVETEALDDFLSHDWQTPRWMKVLALLIIHNSKAAGIASLVASCLIGILRAVQLLPNEPWTLCIGHAVFGLVLSFWQRLRLLFCKPKMMFLDKLCITQHDEDLKRKGILGLPAFLNCSQRFTILWSARYFNRLFCAYEVATFLARPREDAAIRLMPVKLAAIIFMVSAACHASGLGYWLLVELTVSRGSEVPNMLQFCLLWVSLTPLLATTLPVVFYVGIGLIVEMKELPLQLAKFRIEASECYCCSNNHRHPETGEVLRCDRQLILKTLQAWHTGSDEGHVEAFNELVRGQLASVISSVLHYRLPLRYIVSMMCSCSFPSLACLIPKLATIAAEGGTFTCSLRAIMHWAYIFLVAVFWPQLCLHLFVLGTKLMRRVSRVAATAVVVSISFACVTAAWMAFQLTVAATACDSLMPAVPFLLFSAVNLMLCRLPESLKSIVAMVTHRPIGASVLPKPDSSRIPEAETASTFSI